MAYINVFQWVVEVEDINKLKLTNSQLDTMRGVKTMMKGAFMDSKLSKSLNGRIDIKLIWLKNEDHSLFVEPLVLCHEINYVNHFAFRINKYGKFVNTSFSSGRVESMHTIFDRAYDIFNEIADSLNKELE